MKILLDMLGRIRYDFYAGFLLIVTSYLSSSTVPFVCASSLLLSLFSFYYGYLSLLKISPDGKAVLITGCDTGFGHYLAIHLHEIGFQVFAGCLNDEGEGALRLKKANHGKNAIHVLKLDVTRDEDVELAKKYVFKNLKDTVLWGIVNNAGISVSAGFIESKPLDLFEKVSAVNLFGVVRVTKAFLPYIRRNRGRIVNVSSLMGRFVMPAGADYAISKYGVEAFSDSLRLEMKQFGVKVCVIQPGNFMGATRILGHPGSHYSMRYFWNLMDEEARSDYGTQAMEWQEKLLLFGTTQSIPTTEPIVKAMTEALCRVHPQTHYFVARLSDRLGIYLAESLPAWLADEVYEIVMKVRVAWELG